MIKYLYVAFGIFGCIVACPAKSTDLSALRTPEWSVERAACTALADKVVFSSVKRLEDMDALEKSMPHTFAPAKMIKAYVKDCTIKTNMKFFGRAS